MNTNNKNITIDEQDLFTFVFFPENLREDKKLIIESDKSFAEIIEFYMHLKLDSVKGLDNYLKQKISEKIPAYHLSNVIQLFALREPMVTRRNGNHLAADSKELKPTMTTKTFVDNEKEYLIKVLNFGDTTKVFVFSTKDEVIKNFNIVIEPQNLKYHFNDNSEPLTLEDKIEANSITLRIE